MRKALRLWFLLVLPWLAPTGVTADDAAASIHVRDDTDGTTVVTPRVGGRLSIVDEETHIEASYAADVWTSASIDIRTAATKRVTEQRDELTVAADRELVDLTLRADYRFSFEPDYVSHGGGISVEHRMAQGSATLGARIGAARDSVGRAGDDDFDRGLSTISLGLTYTQVIDPRTIMQATYEATRRDGYQSSPYRFVGVGGDGLCAGTAQLCVPETHPSLRLRNAVVLRAKRAFGKHVSAGLAYRFYADDWGILSHTGIVEGFWLPTERSTLGLRYRFYQQSAAAFYEARYDLPPGPLQFVSRDRELSPMFSNRLALSLEHDVDLTGAGPVATITLAAGATVLSYRDFVGLDRIFAFDAVAALEVDL